MNKKKQTPHAETLAMKALFLVFLNNLKEGIALAKVA